MGKHYVEGTWAPTPEGFHSAGPNILVVLPVLEAMLTARKLVISMTWLWRHFDSFAFNHEGLTRWRNVRARMKQSDSTIAARHVESFRNILGVNLEHCLGSHLVSHVRVLHGNIAEVTGWVGTVMYWNRLGRRNGVGNVVTPMCGQLHVVGRELREAVHNKVSCHRAWVDPLGALTTNRDPHSCGERPGQSTLNDRHRMFGKKHFWTPRVHMFNWG